MGTPYVTITKITKVKISDEVGHDRTLISFQFDTDVFEWLVRCNGVDYQTGTICDGGNKYVITHASKTVEELARETVIDVNVFPANTVLTAEIDWTELYGEGANRINIYGVDYERPRNWTPYDQQ